MAQYDLHVFGPVRLVDAAGNDRTPASLKARGILALLSMSVGYRLSRAALMDKLWSDRARTQAGNSLSKDLERIKGRADQPLLVRGNGWVGLDTDLVRVDFRQRDPDKLNAAFAADLDTIRDPEFEDWLRDTRTQVATAPERPDVPDTPAPAPVPEPHRIPRRIRIVIGECEANRPDYQIDGHAILRDAAGRAEQLCHAVVQEGPVDALAANEVDLVISCQIVATARRVTVLPALHARAHAGLVWSQRFAAPPEAADDMLAEATDALTVALVSATLNPPGDAAVEAAARQLPFSSIFSFDADRLHSADAVLAERFEQDGSGTLLALRAYVRHTLIMERLGSDPERLRDEAQQMVRQAIERAPQSGLVLALGSLITGLNGDDALAMDLAHSAERADPDHSLVRHCLSSAFSFSGQADAAHHAALAARKSRMAVLTPSIMYLRNAYSAIGIGDHEQALKCAEMAIQSAPDFRAAHRVVAALRFALGNEAGALHSLQRLKVLEPDFSLDLLESDTYPVDTLRSAGLLAIARSNLV
jgi:tetratricopeptide (TPR) repeat protein